MGFACSLKRTWSLPGGSTASALPRPRRTRSPPGLSRWKHCFCSSSPNRRTGSPPGLSRWKHCFCTSSPNRRTRSPPGLPRWKQCFCTTTHQASSPAGASQEGHPVVKKHWLRRGEPGGGLFRGKNRFVVQKHWLRRGKPGGGLFRGRNRFVVQKHWLRRGEPGGGLFRGRNRFVGQKHWLRRGEPGGGLLRGWPGSRSSGNRRAAGAEPCLAEPQLPAFDDTQQTPSRREAKHQTTVLVPVEPRSSTESRNEGATTGLVPVARCPGSAMSGLGSGEATSRQN